MELIKEEIKKTLQDKIINYIKKNYKDYMTQPLTAEKDFPFIEIKKQLPNNLIILFLSNKLEIKFCKNIHSYVKEEQKYRQEYQEKLNFENSENPQMIYYRGNKLNYDLKTSLYRIKRFVINEHIINRKLI